MFDDMCLGTPLVSTLGDNCEGRSDYGRFNCERANMITESGPLHSAVAIVLWKPEALVLINRILI